MTNKPVLKTTDHHWWPQALARLWADDGGVVHQLFSDGRLVPQTNPKKFGHIKNGHLIKLAADPGVSTPWDQDFEEKFSRADSAIPDIIRWLEGLPFEKRFSVAHRRERFVPASQDWEKLNLLLELLIALVVRSPRFRNLVKGATEYARSRMGFTDAVASKSLLNANLRDTLERFLEPARDLGKFAVLMATENEFIFGDGFFHSYVTSSHPPLTPEILLPLTPQIAVLWAIPTTYSPEPNLVTVCLNPRETEIVNETVLTHSKDFVFYRSKRPRLTEHFERREHLTYVDGVHPTIHGLIRDLAHLRVNPT